MKDKKRLGKGLSALIPSFDTSLNETVIDGTILIKNIIPNKNQPRLEFNENDMNDLTLSIKTHGVIQPIAVRQLTNKKFELIAGERRVRASKNAGLIRIPAYILSINADVEMMEYALVENLQRKNLTAIEEAEAFALLKNKYNLTQNDISKRIGKSRSAIANTLRLLKLPNEIKEAIKKGLISEGHARTLLSSKNLKILISTFKLIMDKSLSVHETQRIINNENKDNIKKPPTENDSSNTLIDSFEHKLSNKLKSKVKIKFKNNSGSIIIRYSGLKNLKKLINQIIDK